MKRFLLALLLVLSFTPCMHGMIFDNRYIPLFQRPPSRHHDRLSNIRIEADFTTASKAFGSDEEEVELFQLNGKYDQMAITRTLATAYPSNTSLTSFLPSELIASSQEIPWTRAGKLETQLIDLYYSQAVTR